MAFKISIDMSIEQTYDTYTRSVRGGKKETRR
jgi:hypothetical protein